MNDPSLMVVRLSAATMRAPSYMPSPNRRGSVALTLHLHRRCRARRRQGTPPASRKRNRLRRHRGGRTAPADRKERGNDGGEGTRGPDEASLLQHHRRREVLRHRVLELTAVAIDVGLIACTRSEDRADAARG